MRFALINFVGAYAASVLSGEEDPVPSIGMEELKTHEDDSGFDSNQTEFAPNDSAPYSSVYGDSDDPDDSVKALSQKLGEIFTKGKTAMNRNRAFVLPIAAVLIMALLSSIDNAKQNPEAPFTQNFAKYFYEFAELDWIKIRNILVMMRFISRSMPGFNRRNQEGRLYRKMFRRNLLSSMKEFGSESGELETSDSLIGEYPDDSDYFRGEESLSDEDPDVDFLQSEKSFSKEHQDSGRLQGEDQIDQTIKVAEDLFQL